MRIFRTTDLFLKNSHDGHDLTVGIRAHRKSPVRIFPWGGNDGSGTSDSGNTALHLHLVRNGKRNNLCLSDEEKEDYFLIDILTR